MTAEHWPGCWNCGPAHYECAIEEIKRLVDESHANMMRAAALEPEITRLRALMTPRPIETALDGEPVLAGLWVHCSDGTRYFDWYVCTRDDKTGDAVTRDGDDIGWRWDDLEYCLPLPEDPK